MPGVNKYCYISKMWRPDSAETTEPNIITVQRKSFQVKPGEREYRISRYSRKKDAYVWISELGEFPTAEAAQAALDAQAKKCEWVPAELEWNRSNSGTE